MSNYRRFIHSLATSHINRVFLNSDEDKMIAVFTEIFNFSSDIVRIFAGSLCNPSTESSAYIEALSDFIERKGRLKILLNNFDVTKVQKTNLYKRLAYYKSEGADIEIKSTSATPYIIAKDGEHINIHFAVGDDKSYRVENDTNNRTAICNMSDKETAKELASVFDRIFDNQSSLRVDLAAIFAFYEK